MANVEIQSFYNDFSQSVLLKDFSRRNLRHVALMDLCNQFVKRGDRILEIGCGVGILSKHLAKRGSEVLSLDVSEKNIRVAKKYATSKKNCFKVIDVCSYKESMLDFGSFDIIVLADVIEHIQKYKHNRLLDNLSRILNKDGKIIISYPNPLYQRYLKENKPEALQIIDEEIEFVDLIGFDNLCPVYFKLIDVWQNFQYAHLVLMKKSEYEPKEPIVSLFLKLKRTILAKFWILKNMTFMRNLK